MTSARLRYVLIAGSMIAGGYLAGIGARRLGLFGPEQEELVERGPPPDPGKRYDIDVRNHPVRGPAAAAVTIVEFGDFECPFCKRATETLQAVQRKYGELVRVVWRDYPLPSHGRAVAAAVAARAAAEQGAFWGMHDRLFGNQRDLSDENLRGHARALGLRLDKFDKFVRKASVQREVVHDQKDALRLGLPGVPSFFVNGRFRGGAPPFEELCAMVDRELASVAPRP